MGFNDLPEFPQGGVARTENGNQGIPPESFQQALQDAGSSLITSTKRPEDNPAVQAALAAEVDALSRGMGFAPQPAAPPAPGQPETPAAQARMPQPGAPTSPPRPPDDLSDRIRRVMEKYSSTEELAKAYIHTDAARTRSEQMRASEIAALRGELQMLRSELNPRNAAPPYAAPAAASPAPGMPPGPVEDPEEFFKNPAANIRNLVNDVVTTHLSAYNEAQRQFVEQQQFDRLRSQMQKDIDRLRPFMDEIYAKDRDLYDALPQDRALTLLVERAHDREEAYRARAYHQEITQILGGNGTPAPGAAPVQTGALPSGNVGRRVETPPSGNWSNTPNFNRLWKSRSDSVDEMGAITDILKERGFGEDIPIY